MLEVLAGVNVEAKSRWMYKKMNDLVKSDPGTMNMLIVPEQFTLQAEKSYLNTTNECGIMNPEVLSFNRFSYRVFQETGGRCRIVIDELGKHILIRKIIQDLSDQLLLYNGLTNERGFIDKVVESITECKQYNISPASLRIQAETVRYDFLLQKKLLDLALIYETFEERDFFDREDQFYSLVEQMEKSRFVKDTVFWIDGFFSFTPHMMRVVNKLCRHASAVHLTAVGTQDELMTAESPLFRQTQHLMESLRQQGIKVIITDTDTLSAGSNQKPVIAHLSQSINQLNPQVWKKSVDGLTLFRAMNDDSEIEMIAAKIMRLVQDQNFRFCEISVLCAELEQRKESIKRIFDLYDIPYFLDAKRKAVEHPLLQLITSVLETIRQGFTYQSMMRYIKTGYAGLNQEETEILENYVLARGIRGSMWKKSFTAEHDTETLTMNHLREKLMPPVITLETSLKQAANVREMTAAMLIWLQALCADKQISDEVNQLKKIEDFEAAALTTQLWNRIMALMDQMVEMVGDTTVTLKDYLQLWLAGSDSIEIGLIPSTIDQVMVGTPERSRQAGIKALFLMGVNDGVLPASPAESGILITSDKMELSRNGCVLGELGEARQAQEDLYIQLAICRPDEYLWISYSQASIEGDARRPSILIERLKKICPELAEQSDLVQDSETVMERLRRPKACFIELAARLREIGDGKPLPDYWVTLYHWFMHQSEWREDAEKLSTALFYKNQPPVLSNDQVKKMFGQHYTGSISRLEQFNQCPFSHFIRFGLKPIKRKQHEIEIPEIGTLLHQAMDAFGGELDSDPAAMHTLADKNQLASISERIVDELLDQFGNGIFSSNARFSYQGQRLKRVSLRAMETMLYHLQNSGFQPRAYEMSFGRSKSGSENALFEIRTSDGIMVSLEGRIDRLDLFVDDNTCYYRVIDYKSGKKEFSVTEIFYGLQLQLLVYLMAAMEQFDDEAISKLNKKPAGLFYFYLDDPMIKMDTLDEATAVDEIRKALKLNGLVLRDMNVIREMDHSMEKQSLIVPVSLTAAGELTKNSKVISEEEFELLQKFVKTAIFGTANAILQGVIRAEPAQLGDWKACQYCDYHGICQYDESFAGNLPRKLRKMKDQDAMEKIREMMTEPEGEFK